jgi:hypothetical protein
VVPCRFLKAEGRISAHDWDFLSVVLEIVAFFLVTVELHGEQRLRELHDHLVPCLQKVRLMHERSTDHELVASPFFIVMSILIFVRAYKIRPYLGLPVPDPSHRRNDLWQAVSVASG